MEKIYDEETLIQHGQKKTKRREKEKEKKGKKRKRKRRRRRRRRKPRATWKKSRVKTALIIFFDNQEVAHEKTCAWEIFRVNAEYREESSH